MFELPAIPVIWTLTGAAAYLWAQWTLRRRGVRWPMSRALAFVTGTLVVALALVPASAPGLNEFEAHMGQHILIGMFAPILFALSAPGTLLLRVTTGATRRRVVALLHSPVVRVLVHPVAATLVSLAGLIAVYFTPLYDLSAANPVIHELVHVHFFLSGCAVAWAFVGLDPHPRRPSFTTRLVASGVLIAGHGAVAKYLYAGYAQVTSESAEAVRQGAQLMYYGGEPFHLLLVGAMFVQHYRARSRAESHARRRRQAITALQSS